MCELMKGLARNHPLPVLGSVASMALLAMFLVFQGFGLSLLKLEPRWLIVSGVPLLAALLVGGYIKSFKGFGVELEAGLKKPVSSIKLSATEALEELDGDYKRGLDHLHQLAALERRRIGRLVFFEGRRNYYQADILEEYLKELRGLKYLEIRSVSGNYLGLIPLQEFKKRANLNYERILDLIRQLEQSSTSQAFRHVMISKTVSMQADLLHTLKTMRQHNLIALTVLGEDEQVVGVLSIRDVERKVLDAVLAAKENG